MTRPAAVVAFTAALLVAVALGAWSGGRSSDPPAGPAGPIAATGDTDSGSADTATASDTIVATTRPEVQQVVARSGPSADAPAVSQILNPRPTGAPVVFVVVAGSEVAAGAEWLEVQLPVRPNGTTGWVSAADVTLARNPYRIEIETGTHRLRVLEADAVVVETAIGVGTGDTPTPLGSFYLTELLQPVDPSGPYGTHAYGLSGFSETLTEFNGGNGVIGIHGTNDPGSLGTDVSHGCIRVANDIIDDMATFLPLGTPVDIVA